MQQTLIPRPEKSKQRQKARLLTILAAFLLLMAATTIVVEHTHIASVPVAEAGAYDCVAGILTTGAAFIMMWADPPLAGIAFYLGWGSAALTGDVTVQACQTTHMANLVRAHNQWCGSPYTTSFLGYYQGFNWTTYGAKYAKWNTYGHSVGCGGGGGGSGSW